MAWEHRLSGINPETKTGNCAACGPVQLWRRGKRFCCSLKYKEIARRRKPPKYRRPYRVHLEDSCERCGFIPEDICQLDIDHTDGNHSNNSPENLSTLCANCHRLKTKRERLGLWP